LQNLPEAGINTCQADSFFLRGQRAKARACTRPWRLPRKKFREKPALVVELKWDKNASGAISQIKEKECCRSLEEYRGNILLVGVNYNKKTKEHECIIEEISLP
jgi:hypothetical protein